MLGHLDETHAAGSGGLTTCDRRTVAANSLRSGAQREQPANDVAATHGVEQVDVNRDLVNVSRPSVDHPMLNPVASNSGIRLSSSIEATLPRVAFSANLRADDDERAQAAESRRVPPQAAARPAGPLGVSVPQSANRIDLYWLPLGAGGYSVRLGVRGFEAVVSRLEQRHACDLYHSALEVRVPEGTLRDRTGARSGRRRSAARRRHRWRGWRALGRALSGGCPGRCGISESRFLGEEHVVRLSRREICLAPDRAVRATAVQCRCVSEAALRQVLSSDTTVAENVNTATKNE